MEIFKKKPFSEADESYNKSNFLRTLGAFDLIMLAIGSIIGTGVFVLTGVIAAKYSGPAIIISYAIAGISCIFVALAYTELASMLPTSGGAYTYSYVAFGQLAAWITFSIIAVETIFGAATVAAGWSAYASSLLSNAGLKIPFVLINSPLHGGIINLPALIIVIILSIVLYLGTTDTKKLTKVLMAIKALTIITFILVAIPHFNSDNWNDFMPFGTDEMLVGSSILFFSFSGFNVIATAVEECKNPERDLKIGIIGSILISSIVYILIAGLLTGISHYSELNNPQPILEALIKNNSPKAASIISIGIVLSMVTVILGQLFGVSRMTYVVARDGLLPKQFLYFHPKYNSPVVVLLCICSLTAFLASFVPYDILGQLASMAALTDYIIVVAAAIFFRFKLPEAKRPFKCPYLFIVGPIALLLTSYLLCKQVFGKNGELLFTGKLMILWLGAFVILYFVSKSFVNNSKRSA